MEETLEEAPVVEQTPAVYIGTKKVTSTEAPKEGWTKYTLEDNRTGLVTDEQFASMKSDTAYEDGKVVVKQWSPVTVKVLKLLLEVDMPMGDLDFIVFQIKESVLNNASKAVSKKFSRALENDIRLSQIDAVLKTDTELIKE